MTIKQIIEELRARSYVRHVVWPVPVNLVEHKAMQNGKPVPQRLGEVQVYQVPVFSIWTAPHDMLKVRIREFGANGPAEIIDNDPAEKWKEKINPPEPVTRPPSFTERMKATEQQLKAAGMVLGITAEKIDDVGEVARVKAIIEDPADATAAPYVIDYWVMLDTQGNVVYRPATPADKAKDDELKMKRNAL